MIKRRSFGSGGRGEVVKVAIEARESVGCDGVALRGGVGRSLRGVARSKELAFARDVCGPVAGFPSNPCFAGSGEGFPFIGGAGEMAGGQNRGGGDGEELIVGHREVGAGELPLALLEEVDVLWDAIRLVVVRHHLGGEIDELAGMEASAVRIEVLDELLRP